jgi:D-glycero-D-manno-heptose 1,7-bisphosphate phosphatase
VGCYYHPQELHRLVSARVLHPGKTEFWAPLNQAPVMTRAAFLDRDGVINKKAPDDHYVIRWEDFHFLPGVVEGIAQLNRAGLRVIVVTNQRCVAKGLLTEAELINLHQRMTEHLARAGATIDAIYYCPHGHEACCNCRKPAPGMLLEAARFHGIDLAASWMIGDSNSDIQAGKSAGCRTARLSGKQRVENDREKGSAFPMDAEITASSFLDLIHQILQLGHS